MIFFRRPYPVKAISFDLDDTLYDNAPNMAAAEQYFASLLHERYQLPDCAAQPAFWTAIKDKIAADPAFTNNVTVQRVEAVLAGCAQLGKPLSGGRKEAQALVELFIRKRSAFSVPQRSHELLYALSERYTLAAVSNGNVDLAAIQIAPYFKYNLRPEGALRRKPWPDLFLEFARLENLQPQDILHVGDDPVTDVEGACAAGCQCAFIDPGFKTQCNDLKRLRFIPTVSLGQVYELADWLL